MSSPHPPFLILINTPVTNNSKQILYNIICGGCVVRVSTSQPRGCGFEPYMILHLTPVPAGSRKLTPERFI